MTSFDVLYHRWVADDRAAVAELARVLRPGGVLLVRVPALRALWGAHDEAVHSRHRYTRAEVKRLVHGAGLEVVRASYGNTLLFPLLAARRTLDRVTGRHGSDVAFLPAPLERAFRALLELEARLIRRVSFPVGASVFALARRPSPPGASGPSAGPSSGRWMHNRSLPKAALSADRISDRLDDGSVEVRRPASRCSRVSCRRAEESTFCPDTRAATSSGCTSAGETSAISLPCRSTRMRVASRNICGMGNAA